MSILGPKKVEITISNRTILRILLSVAAIFLAAHVLVDLKHPLTLILIAFFLSLALNPAVSWVARHIGRKNRTLATAISFLTVLIIVATFFSLVIPPLARQVSEFIKQVPSTVRNVETQDSAVGRAVRHYKLDDQLNNFSSDFSKHISARPVLDTAGRVGGTLVSILAVLAMTFMMLNEGPDWARRGFSLVPEETRKHKMEIARKMYNTVTGYVNGQFIMASIAASFLLVTLLIASSLLNVSVNAAGLAGIMAIFGLIPMIGNPIGALIVVVACLLTSSTLALVMVVYFLIYFQIENITLQPYIQSRQNELTPLIVFVSAILGISFAGILGALFAIPIAGCLRVLFLDWAEHKGHHFASKS